MSDNPRAEGDRPRTRFAPPAWLLFAAVSAASILTVVLTVTAQ